MDARTRKGDSFVSAVDSDFSQKMIWEEKKAGKYKIGAEEKKSVRNKKRILRN